MDTELPDPDELEPDRDAGDVINVDLGPDAGTMTVGDVDGDGRADWVDVVRPDGSTSTLLDSDASGAFETDLQDRDADGAIDMVGLDLDEDAVTDVVQEDEDHDGTLDSIRLVETGTTVRIDPASGLVHSVEEGLSEAEPTPGRPMTADDVATRPFDPAPDATPADEDGLPEGEPTPGRPMTADDVATRPFDPAPDATPPDSDADPASTDEPDAIHGDPWEDLQWAQIQSENGFCVPASVGMIVSEFTGVHTSESDMVGTAIELNLLYGQPGAWIGMTTEGTVELLEHFGVDSHVEYGTLDDLRQHLDDERGIVLMVDADELWTSSPDDVQLTDAGADHAVVITGIDDERAVITLNDPGQPQGAGWEITFADFMDAWDDSNYEMVVTDAAPAGEEAVHGSLSAIRHPVGYVLLPVVVRDEVLRRSREAVEEED